MGGRRAPRAGSAALPVNAAAPHHARKEPATVVRGSPVRRGGDGEGLAAARRVAGVGGGAQARGSRAVRAGRARAGCARPAASPASFAGDRRGATVKRLSLRPRRDPEVAHVVLPRAFRRRSLARRGDTRIRSNSRAQCAPPPRHRARRCRATSSPAGADGPALMLFEISRSSASPLGPRCAVLRLRSRAPTASPAHVDVRRGRAVRACGPALMLFEISRSSASPLGPVACSPAGRLGFDTGHDGR